MSEKTFKFPESLLRQIDECSAGGFILFAIDTRGIPQVYCKFDNSIVGLGLQKFALNWSQALDEIHTETLAEGIKPHNSPSGSNNQQMQ